MTETRNIIRNAAILAALLTSAVYLGGCTVKPDANGIVNLWERGTALGNRMGVGSPMAGAYDLGECNRNDITGCGSKIVGTHSYYVDALANGKLGFTNKKTGEFVMAEPLAKGTRLRRASDVGATVSFKD